MLAAGGAAGDLRLFELPEGRERSRLAGHADLVYGAAFSPDGRRLVTAATDFNVRLWDVASGLEVFTWRDLPEAAYAPSGRPTASGWWPR